MELKPSKSSQFWSKGKQNDEGHYRRFDKLKFTSAIDTNYAKKNGNKTSTPRTHFAVLPPIGKISFSLSGHLHNVDLNQDQSQDRDEAKHERVQFSTLNTHVCTYDTKVHTVLLHFRITNNFDQISSKCCVLPLHVCVGNVYLVSVTDCNKISN